ncbi:hypothetical protein H4696_006465 [Amycolatopsis lexingtonensis]|uniref:XRE family transcriptional regulator n=1 Tax=Amycolatopsis lexingtonensis TaxID=218822 RepID=A0ABR9I860_9PSEU|nr:hypothetical protein [Amycolatopsis lexingtonensis]MBE1499365.1 hypothetical protein [Amycolatopsis lexingtonensis]
MDELDTTTDFPDEEEFGTAKTEAEYMQVLRKLQIHAGLNHNQTAQNWAKRYPKTAVSRTRAYQLLRGEKLPKVNQLKELLTVIVSAYEKRTGAVQRAVALYHEPGVRLLQQREQQRAEERQRKQRALEPPAPADEGDRPFAGPSPRVRGDAVPELLKGFGPIRTPGEDTPTVIDADGVFRTASWIDEFPLFPDDRTDDAENLEPGGRAARAEPERAEELERPRRHPRWRFVLPGLALAVCVAVAAILLVDAGGGTGRSLKTVTGSPVTEYCAVTTACWAGQHSGWTWSALGPNADVTTTFTGESLGGHLLGKKLTRSPGCPGAIVSWSVVAASTVVTRGYLDSTATSSTFGIQLDRAVTQVAIKLTRVDAGNGCAVDVTWEDSITDQ